MHSKTIYAEGNIIRNTQDGDNFYDFTMGNIRNVENETFRNSVVIGNNGYKLVVHKLVFEVYILHICLDFNRILFEIYKPNENQNWLHSVAF